MMVRGRALACASVMLALLRPAAASTETRFGPFANRLFDGVRAEAADSPDATGFAAYRFEGGRNWPAIRLHAGAPLDWSKAGSLTLRVENPGSTPFRLLLRLDDDARADGGDRSLTGITEVAPHVQTTVVLPLGATSPGMRGQPQATLPARPGDQVVKDVRGAVDLHHIVALHISGVRTAVDQVLRIGLPTLRDATPGRSADSRIVDAFGQSVHGDWPEKVASDDQLRARLRDAQAQTHRLAQTAFPLADRYGGVEASTRLAATGFFRVARHNGRWSLVTPAGHLFFSLGVDAVMASNPTIVAGRASLFEGLPDVHAARFDVGEANLARGLGSDWRTRWPHQVIGRLKAWGFNTLGNWSEADLTDAGTMPHVSFYDVEGASAEVPQPGGRSLPDPFDPRFAGVADAVAAEMTASRRSDPFLIGYFSGNELPWGEPGKPEQGIAARVLVLGPDSFAKLALVEDLRARYGTAAAFGSAWGLPGLADWGEVLDRPVTWPTRASAAAVRDGAAFAGRFAERYFRTVAQAIKRHDPYHLYLGTRFAAFTPEVVAACARWCDVLSFNVYGRSPEEAAAAWRPLDRPVLIGEFHFGSTDRGSFWPGMVDVGREDERGPAYAAYVAAAVRDPDIVGVHWYQYADEPLTGRPYDGENGHIGLVAVTDVPYAGFVGAVAAANRRALESFSGPVQADLRGTQ